MASSLRNIFSYRTLAIRAHHALREVSACAAVKALSRAILKLVERGLEVVLPRLSHRVRRENRKIVTSKNLDRARET